MQHPTSKILYSYWNEIRGERIAPRRFDIEPSQLGTALSETVILECDGAEPPTFRLAGTKLCDAFDRDFRGTRFIDLFWQNDRPAVASHISELRTQGAVQVLTVAANVEGRTLARFEITLMPLVHGENSLSRILGCIGTLEKAPGHPSLRNAELVLMSYERIWPEGRPHAIAEKFRSAPPLIPELAGARLVRSHRRSFRVLDGGLGKE